jgi:hypothetical protein
LRSIIAIAGALVIALLLLVPAVLAAEPLPSTGRVLISTEGDISVPAGQHADLVVVVNGTATIEGEVNTIVAVDGTAILTDARTETVIWLGDWLLHRLQPAVTRSRPFLPAVVGILLLQVLSFVPILALVAMIASLFGFGAVVLLAWRTVRSSGAPRPAVAGAAPAPIAS